MKTILRWSLFSQCPLSHHPKPTSLGFLQLRFWGPKALAGKAQSAEAAKEWDKECSNCTTPEPASSSSCPLPPHICRCYNFTWGAFLWVSCRTQSQNPSHQNTKALEVRDISVNLQIFRKSTIICRFYTNSFILEGEKRQKKEKKQQNLAVGRWGIFPITADGLTNCREPAGSWLMEGNSSHTEEAPLGICHSVAGPQFPGHSSCCFGKEIKDSSRVENPKFSELGKCRSTVSTGKALPGAQSWAKTQIKVTPISLQTTCVRHDPATRSPHTTAGFAWKENMWTSLETTFSEMLQIWFSSLLGVLSPITYRKNPLNIRSFISSSLCLALN